MIKFDNNFMEDEINKGHKNLIINIKSSITSKIIALILCVIVIFIMVETVCGEQNYDLDLNEDGITDGFDILVIKNNWKLSNEEPGWIKADLNKDGIIDVLDLTVFGQYFYPEKYHEVFLSPNYKRVKKGDNCTINIMVEAHGRINNLTCNVVWDNVYFELIDIIRGDYIFDFSNGTHPYTRGTVELSGNLKNVNDSNHILFASLIFKVRQSEFGNTINKNIMVSNIYLEDYIKGEISGSNDLGLSDISTPVLIYTWSNTFGGMLVLLVIGAVVSIILQSLGVLFYKLIKGN